MDRLELIQSLINKKKFKKYLEIGVLDGYIFFQVKCKNKIAVDPAFKFDRKRKLQAIRYNWCNFSNHYFEVKSDDFFESNAAEVFYKKKIDLSFVDGMHEFRYVLNDVENSLKYLEDDGVIVLHDCNPLTKEAECSFEDWGKRGYTGFWNGDTWKTIKYLLHNRPDLDVFTLDCDFGLGVVRKLNKNEERKGLTPMSYAEIDALRFEDLNKNRTVFLNLKNESFAGEYFKF